jgi:protoheme IX farnesyltransferase
VTLAQAVSTPGSTRLSAMSATVAGYVALTKPRIIELLLVTTVPSMVLAAQGVPGLGVAAATLVGGTLAAGSANSLNCYLDRDIDAVMSRTADRPLNGSVVSPRGALVFGFVLGVIAVLGLWATTNGLTAWLTLAAIAFYVVVYTMVLIWTPPHFWALAMRFRADYAAAGVPMLPVVADDGVVARRIAIYSWVMVGTSLLLWPVAGMSAVYGVSALVLGGVFLREAHGLLRAVREGRAGSPNRLFHWSITYLSLLFAAVALDVVLRGWL